MNSSVSGEMPKYRCHKEVHALKIANIEQLDWNAEKAEYNYRIVVHDDGFEPIRVSEDYIRKHNPKNGGYYVVYKGGYISFSPAEAFEEGYTRI